ncbi:MAG: NosD domain-containing protein [Chloroflexota bacterium]
MREAATPRSQTDKVTGQARSPHVPWRAWARPVAAIVGPALLVVAGILPVWGTTLLAPQYPKGLSLWFYGGRAEGPVREVNALNHYIGMQPIDLSLVPEMGLWPLAVVGPAAAFLVAILLRGWIGRVAAILLALTPIVILGDIQRWLYIFGSELDPGSALRLDPFIPLVVGPSTVWNFTVWTYPGPALAVIWTVAILAFAVRRLAPATGRPNAITTVAAAAGAAVALIGALLVVVPAARAPEASVPDVAVAAGTADLVRLVAEAPSGATVAVPAGRYFVHLDIIRPITLVASGEVVLDGGGRGTPVTIRSDDVTIRGFTVANTGGQVEEAAGIRTIDASRVTIEHNRLETFFTGIAVDGGGAVRIIGNEFLGSGQVVQGADHIAVSAASAGSSAGSTGAGAGADPGADPGAGGVGADPHAGHGPGAGPGGQGDAISIWTANGMLIRDNRVSGVRDAIYLNYAADVLVDGNVVERSRYALHSMFGSTLMVFGNESRENLSGLVFMYGTDVIAGRNIIVDGRSAGTGFGVVLKDVDGVRLAENLIARNRVGLQAEGTVNRLDTEAAVFSNRFVANDVGVALMPSADLAFGGNVFDGNLTQVAALGIGVERRNFWAYRGVGNTWSDYAGYDLEGDGIGDVPYRSAGVEDILVLRDPSLAAFRTSPAMIMLGTSQAVWEGARPPVVIDPSPRRDQVGAAAAPSADGGSRPLAGPWQAGPWQLAGASLLAVTAVALGGPWRRGATEKRGPER